MSNYRVLNREFEREHEVRKVACPVCGANVTAPCLWPPDELPPLSHTGRYNRAASEGLVPKLPGVDRA